MISRGALHCHIFKILMMMVLNIKELPPEILTIPKTYLMKVLSQQSNKNLLKMAIFSSPKHTRVAE